MKNKQRSFQLTGDFLSFESNELEASLLFKMFMREMRKKRGRSLATRMEPRNFILDEIKNAAEHDPLKQAFLVYLGLIEPDASVPAPSQVYMRCAVSGLNAAEKNTSELARLLGQASYMDGTPMPWVSDIWSVLGIKWAVDNSGDTTMIPKFAGWVNDFLPKQIKDGRLSLHEKAIAEYILANELSLSSASCVVLFLHYKGILPLQDAKQKEKCLKEFYAEFQDLYKLQHSKLTLALFIYVFDAINKESAAVPPHMWGKEDIILFLENLPAGRSLATRMEPRRVEVTIRFFEPEVTKPEQNVS